MTLNEFYGAVLVELNKEEAPTLSLFEFNYYLKKSIQEYINKRYNIFETTQQTTDDLQVLKKQTILQGNKIVAGFYKNSFKADLPNDYFHITGVWCNINSPKIVCGVVTTDRIDTLVPVKKANDAMYPFVETNEFDKPNWKEERIYYHIYNSETSNKGNIEILAGLGANESITQIGVSYLKEANKYRVKSDELIEYEESEGDIDASTTLEFPEYVCNELVKNFVTLVFEQQSNERIGNYTPVNTSIPVSLQ